MLKSLTSGFWVHFLGLPEDVKKDHAKMFGGYNDFPPNWKPMTEAELTELGALRYVPVLVEHRQMIDRRNPMSPCLNANLFYFSDGRGYAMSEDSVHHRILYFSFASCDHQWGPVKDEKKARSLLIGTCTSASQCEKCDQIMFVDSSD